MAGHDDDCGYGDYGTEYESLIDFDIDDGQLTDTNPVKAFVFGYAFCRFILVLDTGRYFRMPIHPENADRVTRMLNLRGRDFRSRPRGPNWIEFEVQELS